MARQLPSAYFKTFDGFDIINGTLGPSSHGHLSATEDGRVQDMFSQTSNSVYGRLPDTEDAQVRDMFSKTQVGLGMDFHQHPVVLMTVNWMQKQHGWNWINDKAYKVLFPGLDLSGSPEEMTIERPNNSRLRNGANGMLAKCFYNGNSKSSEMLNETRAESEIEQLNRYFDDNASFLYAEYFRHTYAMEPSASRVSQYKSLLLSKAYRYLKLAQLTSGSWSTPEVEMHGHMVKLLACGATQGEVRDVYHQLTTVAPILPVSTFPALTESRWQSYRSWLGQGIFDFHDMKAQNLQAWQLAGRMVMYIDDMFANRTKYWKPGVGSCFSAGTKVVLADGTLKDIERIRAGDKVRSSSFGGGRPRSHGESTVAHVTNPRRAGRTLYAFCSAPTIRFTNTHPFVGRDADVLEFVDPDLARSLNPTWLSTHVASIPPEELTQFPAGQGDKEEILYDLILDPPPKLPDGGSSSAIAMTYTVADSNGQSLDVISEAPIFEWFPYAAKFFEQMVEGLEGVSTAQLLLLLADKHVSFTAVLDEAAADAWIRMPRTKTTTDKPSGFHLAMRLLRASHHRTGGPQGISDVVERLIGLFGRTINNTIATGWTNKPMRQSARADAPSTTMALILYSIHVSGSVSTPSGYRTVEASVMQGDCEVAAATFCATSRGYRTLECNHGIDIGAASVLRQNDDELVDMTLQVHDPRVGIVYRGKGRLREGCVSLLAMDSGPGNGHATLGVKMKRIRKDALEDESRWGETNTLAFAETLGGCFAKRLKALLSVTAQVEQR